MVTSCAVVGCQSTWNPFTHVSFHRVTKNKKLLPLWLRVVNVKTYDHAKICSLHFKPEDLVDCKDGKRLKPDAVPIFNVSRDEANDTSDDSSEDDEDNENLSILKKLLTSDGNHGTAATRDSNDNSNAGQPHKLEAVISSCNSKTCNPTRTKANTKQMRDAGIQAKKATDIEIALRKKIKVLGLKLLRRDAKISYMTTVLNMIKKNVKGTDLEYKLSCELQNISNLSEPITSNANNNTPRTSQTKPTSPVSDCNNDDEESSADENGMFCDVTLSPNLKSRNET